MSGLVIRPYESKDAEAFMELHNQIRNAPLTRQRYEQMLQHMDVGIRYRKWIVGEIKGRVIAFGSFAEPTVAREGVSFCEVIVDQDYRKRGYGNQLYDVLVLTANERATRTVNCTVQDKDKMSLNWARRKGYDIDAHMFESVLNVEAYSLKDNHYLLRNAEDQGIMFQNFSEAALNKDMYRHLYRLAAILFLQQPDMEDFSQAPTYEEFETMFLKSPSIPLEAIQLARRGPELVGMAVLSINGENEMYHSFTGVQESERGKGIANALRYRTIEYARANGIRRLRTNNSSKNGPMLAVNKKAGYHAEPGIYMLKSTK